uniref:Uncharacterized protein n=1 Tax=Nelumbo nucifera TaxID=4432 RepID=A0A822Z2Q6_NELNU|nr:TPA_asm: hypothetical protein HUJ06_007897 [Nelumbo nucifera]
MTNKPVNSRVDEIGAVTSATPLLNVNVSPAVGFDNGFLLGFANERNRSKSCLFFKDIVAFLLVVKIKPLRELVPMLEGVDVDNDDGAEPNTKSFSSTCIGEITGMDLLLVKKKLTDLRLTSAIWHLQRSPSLAMATSMDGTPPSSLSTNGASV